MCVCVYAPDFSFSGICEHCAESCHKHCRIVRVKDRLCVCSCDHCQTRQLFLPDKLTVRPHPPPIRVQHCSLQRLTLLRTNLSCGLARLLLPRAVL